MALSEKAREKIGTLIVDFAVGRIHSNKEAVDAIEGAVDSHPTPATDPVDYDVKMTMATAVRLMRIEEHVKVLLAKAPDPTTMTIVIGSPWLTEARRLVR